MNSAATSGPSAMNQGRWTRSASQPNTGCPNEDESEASATSVPTSVRLRCSFVTSSGNSGEKKLE